MEGHIVRTPVLKRLPLPVEAAPENGPLIVVHKRHPDLKGISWVAKALQTPRAYTLHHGLDKVQAAFGLAIASDGVRLHGYLLHEPLPEGLYEVKEKKKERIVLERSGEGEYPDWARIWPEGPPWNVIPAVSGKYALSALAAKIVRSLPKGLAINLDLLEDIGAEGMEVHIYPDHVSPILFASERRVALVMPLRV